MPDAVTPVQCPVAPAQIEKRSTRHGASNELPKRLEPVLTPTLATLHLRTDRVLIRQPREGNQMQNLKLTNLHCLISLFALSCLDTAKLASLDKVGV